MSETLKLENQIGELFKSLIGSPQGDAASALFFIIYLATILKQAKQKLSEKDQALPLHLKDHTYTDQDHLSFTVDQQYADDISWALTSKNILENIEKTVPTALSERNLFVNEGKTEKYTIKKNGQNDWRNCKLVGSKLGTEEDFQNRKILTNLAYSSVKTIFQNKNTTACAKLIIFNSLLQSIFMYNSELWALNKSLENKIDTFQRQLLRKIFNIRYGENGENWLSNDQLYEVTKQTPWSKKISERRLRFFGHICRLPQNTPARLVLSESLRPTKQPKGRPQTTYLNVLRNQLKDKNIKTLESAIEIAQNRQFWDCICGSSGNAE